MLLQRLVRDNILIEKTSKADNMYQTVTTVLRVNRQMEMAIKSGRRKVSLDMVAKTNVGTSGKANAKAPLKTKKVPLQTMDDWPCDQSQMSQMDKQMERYHEEVEAELKTLRSDIIQQAKDQGSTVKQYHIFNNGLIASIAELRPASIADLYSLNGWSKNKVLKYGKQVIEVVARVLQKHGVAPRSNEGGAGGGGGANGGAKPSAKRKGGATPSGSGNWQQQKRKQSRTIPASIGSYRYGGR